MISIPDISTWQDSPQISGHIDFVKMKSMTNAVIIKTGQMFKDPDFDINWLGAKEAGLWRGSYWFYDSRMKPNDQADLWRSIIGGDLPECGLWMDLEENFGGAFAGENFLRDFAERVMGNFPSHIDVGVYTAPAWWVARIKARAYWKQFSLWIANYKVTQPAIPPPWTEWFMWQHTDSGNGAAYGVESKEIDLNYYDGTWELFAAEFGLDKPPPDPQTQTMNIKISFSPDGNSGTWIKE